VEGPMDQILNDVVERIPSAHPPAYDSYGNEGKSNKNLGGCPLSVVSDCVRKRECLSRPY